MPKKKKKYTFGVGGDLSDNEYVTTPKVSVSLSKENSDGKKSSVYSSVEKPLNKINKENINSDLTLGYSKTGKNSSFNVEGIKSGKEKNVSFNFTKKFSDGGIARGTGAAIRGKGFKGVF